MTHTKRPVQKKEPKDPKELSVVSGYGEVAVKGRRREMEDAHTIIADFRGNSSEFFAGVYDGHGGRKTADYLARYLHKNLRNELDAGFTAERAIDHAFEITDTQVTREGIIDGSTVVIAYIQNETLFVGNAGDARAVLSRNGKPIRLSHDHKADDPDEVKRIRKAGGFVTSEYQTEIPRVNGILAISRSIGDHGVELDGFISHEPFITNTKLGPTDKSLILACDGVWDVLSDSAAVDIVDGIGDPKEAAIALKDEALNRRSGDNISVIVIKLKIPSSK